MSRWRQQSRLFARSNRSAETQPQLHPALLRLSLLIIQDRLRRSAAHLDLRSLFEFATPAPAVSDRKALYGSRPSGALFQFQVLPVDLNPSHAPHCRLLHSCFRFEVQTFAQISGHSAGLIFVIGEVCEIRPWKVFAAFQKYVRKVALWRADSRSSPGHVGHGRKRTCARKGSHGAALGNRQSLRRAWAVMAQKRTSSRRISARARFNIRSVSFITGLGNRPGLAYRALSGEKPDETSALETD